MAEINIWLTYASFLFLVLALFISLFCLLRFSSIFIRLITLEVLTNIFIAGIAVWALAQRKPLFIDISLALALIMFLSVVAYYQFLHARRSIDD